MLKLCFFLCFLFLLSCSSNKNNVSGIKSSVDNYLWLEEIESTKSLDFVKNENDKTFAVLKNNSHYKELEADIRKIALAEDRVPWVNLMNKELFNFWRDQKNPRGLWRKTTLASYKTNKPKWQIVIDLDTLAKDENENWVWKGAECLPPQYTRCLIHFSRGGKDATVIREFDMLTKSFIKNGFNIPEAKTNVSWINLNTIYVGQDSGPGSLTDSGYPRTISLWHRREKLKEAKLVFQVEKKDLSANAYVEITPKKTYRFFRRGISFYESEGWYLDGTKKIHIPTPNDAIFNGIHKDYLLFTLRSELKTDAKNFKTGSLVALPFKFLSESKSSLNHLELLFEPTKKRFLQNLVTTKNHLLLDLIDNIQGKIVSMTLKSPGIWSMENIDLGNNGIASIESAELEHDTFLATYSDFITPTSLFIGSAKTPTKKMEKIKNSPSRFISSDLVSEQKFSTSKDGTIIPYFIIHKKDMPLNALNPTLLYGYGGFEVSMQPYYLNTLGKVWLEKGGVYVLANIRGGGEFGPAWHQAAVKENHQRVFDDFISVAEALIKEKITTPHHLGIQGGSNGGLLVGGAFIQRPDLFNAVLCGVPLLDMLRYNKLLAGASWMDEYGNPDVASEQEYILKYSPYQNIKADTHYPEVFFTTSTKDDRVHPAHARKMVAKMRELGYPLFYFENTEGGHGGVANIEQGILRSSLEFSYLWKKLQ